MARPIEPTPTLYGEDARRFLQRMREEEENPDPKRLKFLKECYEFYLKHPF
jgi:hypothetical protein